ncbi:MAG: cyclic nucleotide-binding domain-containing protein [Deltaproteobacteria bacterium]|nr:cyclic nucleotide-binding domain-containing protein [Deltaproteobacteria bacterium]
MPVEMKVWEKIDPLVERGRFEEAIQLLEGQIQKCDNPEDLCKVARRLAHLYRSGLKKKGIPRAISYALMAGQAYVKVGRVAPAIAMLSWLKEIPEAKSQVKELEKLVSETFSFSPAGVQFKPTDENMPVPTPFQKIKGFVTFDQEDVELSREQWRETVNHRATLFSTLKPQEVAKLIQMATIRDIGPGMVLFREGDQPFAFYIVVDGEMELTSSVGFKKTFREGDFFGEVALFGKMPRTATLKSKQGAKVLEFSEKDLKKCFKQMPNLETRILNFFEFRLFLNVASRGEFFKSFTEDELEKVWDFMTPIHVPAERVLLEQGAASDRFFFVVKGFCEVQKDDWVITRLGPGQFIGEMGMIHRAPRTAKVVAMTDCQLLECHTTTFQELCEQFPKIRRILEEISKMREPDEEITDKVVID